PNAPMYFCRTKHNHIWAEIRPTNANTLAVGGGKWWWYWWVMVETMVTVVDVVPNAPMYFCRTKHNHIWAEIRPKNVNTLAVGGGKWWWYWWVMVETMVTVVDVVRQWDCGGVEMMWMVDLDWRWLCGDEGGGGCDSEARRKVRRI
nr:hypothetical protein [Tanacetum cinerariifolium]